MHRVRFSFIALGIVAALLIVGGVSMSLQFFDQPPATADAKIVAFVEEQKWDDNEKWDDKEKRHDDEDELLRTYYSAVYEFIDRDGQSHTVTSAIRSTSRSGKIGDTTVIRYFPEHPEEGWVADSEKGSTLVGGIVALAMGACMCFVLWNLRRD